MGLQRISASAIARGRSLRGRGTGKRRQELVDLRIYWEHSVNSFIFSLSGSVSEGVLEIGDAALQGTH